MNERDEKKIKEWVDDVNKRCENVNMTDAARKVCRDVWKTKKITMHDMMWCQFMLQRYKDGTSMKDDGETEFRKLVSTAFQTGVNVDDIVQL